MNKEMIKEESENSLFCKKKLKKCHFLMCEMVIFYRVIVKIYKDVKYVMKIVKINKILAPFGHEICDCHHYYIPKTNVVINCDVKTKWFEKDELEEILAEIKKIKADANEEK